MTRKQINEGSYHLQEMYHANICKDKESHVHTIKRMIVSKQEGFFVVIDLDVIILNTFDTEEAAVNYVLDFYSNRKTK
jgi:hypothetical protein